MSGYRPSATESPWPRRILVGALAVAAVCVATVAALVVARPDPPPAIDRPVRVYTTLAAGTFPIEWTAPPARMEATPPDRIDVPDYLDQIREAVAKYPEAVLTRHLRSVHLLGSMRFNGTDYGLTNSADRLYIAGSGPLPGQIESAFHTGLAVLLLETNPSLLNRSAWERRNPPGFRYGAGGAAARPGRWYAPQDLAEGFVSDWSRDSLENDFGTVAWLLFAPEPERWAWLGGLPRLRAKVDLAIEFYHAIDPVFTEAYFRGLEPE